MKTGIHPKYEAQSFNCSCGNVIEVRATIPGQGIEICSNCHPFYTGKQKILDSAGRIERFTSRYQTIVGAKRKTRSASKDAAKEGPKDAAKEAPKAE
jgi:large subunit ribosomal protein L31